MQDEAAFHGYLALSAFVWANTRRSGSQLETTYHKVECVRIIGSRLNRYEPPSVGTIYAVIWLWALEVRAHKFCGTLDTTELDDSRSLQLLRLYRPI
jgi:hypothetical protein